MSSLLNNLSDRELLVLLYEKLDNITEQFAMFQRTNGETHGKLMGCTEEQGKMIIKHDTQLKIILWFGSVAIMTLAGIIGALMQKVFGS